MSKLKHWRGVQAENGWKVAPNGDLYQKNFNLLSFPRMDPKAMEE